MNIPLFAIVDVFTVVSIIKTETVLLLFIAGLDVK